jgi:hypothetical protein
LVVRDIQESEIINWDELEAFETFVEVTCFAVVETEALEEVAKLLVNGVV